MCKHLLLAKSFVLLFVVVGSVAVTGSAQADNSPKSESAGKSAVKASPTPSPDAPARPKDEGGSSKQDSQANNSGQPEAPTEPTDPSEPSDPGAPGNGAPGNGESESGESESGESESGESESGESQNHEADEEPDIDPSPEKPEPFVPSPKSLAELVEIEAKVKKVVEKVKAATVGVRVGGAGGSAVIISEDGYVLTAAHVVGKPGQKVKFFFADGKTADGIGLGMFKSADAGMMKITTKGKWPHVDMAEESDLAVGAWCVAMGHPLGYRRDRPPVARIGRVLRFGDTTLQTDCPLISGDSGGPLFDLEGRVIGINSRIGGNPMANYHAPITVFQEHFDRLKNKEVWEITLPQRADEDIRKAFREVLDTVRDCVVRVKADGKDKALGTIVGPDGWILTKASELGGKKASVQLSDKRELAASVVGVSEQFDLAMLKVDAEDLPMIEWQKSQPDVGAWLVSAGASEDPLAIGVLSVPQIRVPPVSGKLGIMVSDSPKGPVISKVLPNSAAAKAGLKEKDLVAKVNGKKISNARELTSTVSRFKPGVTVSLEVKRGDKSMSFKPTLTRLVTQATRRRDAMNASAGGLSNRRDDFPAVLQHDSVIKPTDCGSPVVDTSGKVVGVNIARGGRTETYCIPSPILMTLMYDLMSGRLKPEEPETKKDKEEKPNAKKMDAQQPDKKNAEPETDPKAEPKVDQDKADQDKNEPGNDQPGKDQPGNDQPGKDEKTQPNSAPRYFLAV